MFAALLPKSAPFFAMLMEQNELLRRMAALLLKMLESPEERDQVYKEITFLEEEADNLYGKIIRALSQTFITPIDREDILRINQEQEESMDCLHNLSSRLHIFEFSRIRFPALQLVRNINAMLALTQKMLEGLTRREDCHQTRAFHSLRTEGDMLLAVGLAEVMDEHQELKPAMFMQILKWMQTYERMDNLLDRVNSVAETIEEAVLKNV